MKKIVALAFLGLVSSLFFLPVKGAPFAGDPINLAPAAVVSTSFVSSWETLSAVNDGYDPSSSLDYSHGAYGNWDGESNYNTDNWVQVEWPFAQTMTSSSVYWWDDGAGIDQPTDAYITYWNGTSWTGAVDIGTALDQYNSVNLNVRTDKIRIYMVSAMATGILEWRVYGEFSGLCAASTVAPYVQVNNGTPEQTNYANVLVGDSLLLDLRAPQGGDWSWAGPEGFTAATQSVELGNIQTNQSGNYIACYLNSCGAYTTRYFFVSVRSNANISDPYSWPPYDPNISYNFRDEFPALTEPTTELDDCEGVVGIQS